MDDGVSQHSEARLRRALTGLQRLQRQVAHVLRKGPARELSRRFTAHSTRRSTTLLGSEGAVMQLLRVLWQDLLVVRDLLGTC